MKIGQEDGCNNDRVVVVWIRQCVHVWAWAAAVTGCQPTRGPQRIYSWSRGHGCVGVRARVVRQEEKGNDSEKSEKLAIISILAPASTNSRMNAQLPHLPRQPLPDKRPALALITHRDWSVNKRPDLTNKISVDATSPPPPRISPSKSQMWLLRSLRRSLLSATVCRWACTGPALAARLASLSLPLTSPGPLSCSC